VLTISDITLVRKKKDHTMIPPDIPHTQENIS
jgi:hypothetical protein